MRVGGAGGVRVRPHPQPDRRRVAARRECPATTSPRSTVRRSRARRGSSGDIAASAVAHAASTSTRRGARSSWTSASDRVTAAVDAMAAHRDLLALLLVWEIGKPWRLACADVDRALDGVRWYVDEIERQLGDRS